MGLSCLDSRVSPQTHSIPIKGTRDPAGLPPCWVFNSFWKEIFLKYKYTNHAGRLFIYCRYSGQSWFEKGISVEDTGSRESCAGVRIGIPGGIPALLRFSWNCGVHVVLTEAIQPPSPVLTSFLVIKIILKSRALFWALAETEDLEMFIKLGFS